jgi:4-methylaminobutanoate oxidase (formaldehyde-forming)
MRRHFEDAHAFVTDITSSYAQLNIQGPKSRELLQTLTTADLSHENFPFRTARKIDLGLAEALCLRITYLGELGYELYIPTEMATYVYEQLVSHGKAFGLVHAGLKALASCRMEKGYRDWGHDIDNTDDVVSTGLAFTCAFDKPNGFIGRNAVLTKKGKPLTKRLVQVLLEDPEPLLFHAEPVWRNGERVGYIRAASYGFTLGGAVGLAMVDGGTSPVTPGWLSAGRWEVEVGNLRVPARVSLKPLYDPENARIKT